LVPSRCLSFARKAGRYPGRIHFPSIASDRSTSRSFVGAASGRWTESIDGTVLRTRSPVAIDVTMGFAGEVLGLVPIEEAANRIRVYCTSRYSGWARYDLAAVGARAVARRGTPHAATETRCVRRKLAEAVALAKLHGPARVD
jgi:hypothetical protein